VIAIIDPFPGNCSGHYGHLHIFYETLRVTSEQLETLKQSGYEDAKSVISEKISLRLNDLSLDPAKRDKALIAAGKLGIDIDCFR